MLITVICFIRTLSYEKHELPKNKKSKFFVVFNCFYVTFFHPNVEVTKTQCKIQNRKYLCILTFNTSLTTALIFLNVYCSSDNETLFTNESLYPELFIKNVGIKKFKLLNQIF